MPEVKPVPDGCNAVTPYLIVTDADAAIRFYQQAFGAALRMRLTRPDGRIGHAELRIGDATIMLADEYEPAGARSPKSVGGSPVMLHLYVPNVDAVFARAVARRRRRAAAGAGPVLRRPFRRRHRPVRPLWHIATHIEDVPPDEIDRRAAAAMSGQSAGSSS